MSNYYMASLCAIPLGALVYLILSTVLGGRGTLITLLLQVSKQKLRKVRQLTQDQAENKG